MEGELLKVVERSGLVCRQICFQTCALGLSSPEVSCMGRVAWVIVAKEGRHDAMYISTGLALSIGWRIAKVTLPSGAPLRRLC